MMGTIPASRDYLCRQAERQRNFLRGRASVSLEDLFSLALCMREYGKIAPHFWIGKTGKLIRAMGRDAQVVAMYLVTCPSANMLGLYYLPLPTLCHEVRIKPEGALKALRRLSEAHFAYYDTATEHVWVPEMARFQIGERLKPDDKRVLGVKNDLQALRTSPFFNQFLSRYGTVFHLDGVSPSQAPPEPHRSQEQEQEQEKEQRTPPPSPSSLEGATAELWGTPQSLITLYNETAPDECPAVEKLTPARLTKTRQYLKAFPDREFWVSACGEIHRSRFLRGLVKREGHHSFIASLDWLMTKGKDGVENVVKVWEGKYRDD